MPWTESGLVPDIVFNPHGFPSRMTIAMMIENMAGKSGSLHGLCHDATPFRFGSGKVWVPHLKTTFFEFLFYIILMSSFWALYYGKILSES